MRFECKGKERYIVPKAFLALRNIEGIPLHHTEQGMRHPLEIYSTTFSEVIEETVILLEHLNEIENNLSYIGGKNSGWEKQLSSITDNWLDAMIQHIDSCKGVLSCFFSKEQEKQKNKCIKSFSMSIEQYRKEVATIVNYIKHKQRFLRIVYFHWIGGFVPGFFIEGVVEEGVIGPDPVIHKDSNTAISFNRYLPFNFCNLYCISSILAQSIYEITRIPIKKQDKDKYKENKLLEKAFQLLSVTPVTFFPDELQKPVPYIKWHINELNETASIVIEIPSNKIKPSTIPGRCQIVTIFRVGEIYRTYKLPYFSS